MMHKMCLGLCAAVLVAAGCQRADNSAPTETGQVKNEKAAAEVSLKVVKHDAFLKELKAHKGKVVLVDFWATWCGPCKAKFPEFVRLYEKHADKGLVAVSASLDNAAEPKEVDKALQFLQIQEARFSNYLIDETEFDVYEEPWGFRGIPAYFVINRQGEIAENGRFVEGESFAEIEKVLLEQLE